MNGELRRFAYLPTRTLGYLTFGSLTIATIERPWRPDPDGPGGMSHESCVPDGEYSVAPWNSELFPNTFILRNDALGVYLQPNLIPPGQKWGRSAILIHVGNYVSDVIGCIAVGLHHAENHSMVVDSRVAMERLRAVLGKGSHSLTISPRGTT